MNRQPWVDLRCITTRLCQANAHLVERKAVFYILLQGVRHGVPFGIAYGVYDKENSTVQGQLGEHLKQLMVVHPLLFMGHEGVFIRTYCCFQII